MLNFADFLYYKPLATTNIPRFKTLVICVYTTMEISKMAV